MKKFICLIILLFSINSTLQANTPFQLEKSKTKALAQEFEQDLADMDASFTELIDTYNTLYRRIWNNRKFTPEEKIASYGTKGSFILYTANLVKEFITKIDPTYEFKDSPCSLVVNEDGTITILNETCKEIK